MRPGDGHTAGTLTQDSICKTPASHLLCHCVLETTRGGGSQGEAPPLWLAGPGERGPPGSGGGRRPRATASVVLRPAALQVPGAHRPLRLPQVLQDPPVPGALPVRRVPPRGALRLPAGGQLPLRPQLHRAPSLAAAAVLRWGRGGGGPRGHD